MVNKNHGLVLVLSSPSGVGKTSVIEKISSDGFIEKFVTSTSRTIRNGETESSYEFLSIDEFKNSIENEEFIEYENIYGNFYGLKKKILEFHSNTVVALSFNGMLNLKKYNNLLEKPKKIISIFLIPPSMKEMKKRIVDRNRDSIDDIDERMKSSKDELINAKNYDYIVLNDKIEDCVDFIKNIIFLENKKQYFKDFYIDLITNEI